MSSSCCRRPRSSSPRPTGNSNDGICRLLSLWRQALVRAAVVFVEVAAAVAVVLPPAVGALVRAAVVGIEITPAVSVVFPAPLRAGCGHRRPDRETEHYADPQEQ